MKKKVNGVGYESYDIAFRSGKIPPQSTIIVKTGENTTCEYNVLPDGCLKYKELTFGSRAAISRNEKWWKI